MRVIEPTQLQRRSIKKKNKLRLPFVLLAVFGIGGFILWRTVEPKKIQPAETVSQQPEQAQSEEPKQKTNLKIFTNEQFVELYSNFAYPNTAEIRVAPVITGNIDADARIRKLAEERGYKLRSSPVVEPLPLEGTIFLQQKAQQPFKDMIAAAKKEGLLLQITSGFRSVEEQKTIFLERITATPAAIAAGTADEIVTAALKTAAPPGYSRHHNGFTIDLACDGIGLYGFLETNCYTWLSKDNFKNAKEFGWIPSYPDGEHSVGPEPEPWEYVWVGREALLE